MKESIFVFIYGYFPGAEYGGPVTSIFNFTQHFGDRYDIRIVCSDHDANSSQRYDSIHDGWNQVGKAQVLYLKEKEYTTDRFVSVMKPFTVKMVYLTGVFSFFLNHAAICAANKLGIPVVIATRGEICKNILAMKRYKKLPYLFVMKTVGEYKGVYFQATSDEEIEQLKRYLNIDGSRIVLLPNIHSLIERNDLLRKDKGAARMLFISRIHPKKNLKDVLLAVRNVKGDLRLDIYGPIEDKDYWDECRREIEKAPDNVRITYCGALSPEESKKVYKDYHAFTFPTLTENYGHVIVESMLAGCPIILSRGTTPWDDIDGRGGIVCDLHDIDQLQLAIEEIIDADQGTFDDMKRSLDAYAQEKLRMDELIDQYQAMIDGVAEQSGRDGASHQKG